MSVKISNELLMVIAIAIIAGFLLFCANGTGKKEGMTSIGGGRIHLDNCLKYGGGACQTDSDCTRGGKCINRCCHTSASASAVGSVPFRQCSNDHPCPSGEWCYQGQCTNVTPCDPLAIRYKPLCGGPPHKCVSDMNSPTNFSCQ
jgi:hypothetical protein